MMESDAAKIVAVLKAAYPGATVSDETPTAYYLALDDLSYEAVMSAVKVAIRTMRFFPSPAEIRELLAEAATAIEPWEAAWDEIIATRRRYGIYIGQRWGNDAGQWSHPLIAQSLRHVGGYEAVCAGEMKDEPTMRAQFRDAYQRGRAAAVTRAQIGNAALPEGEAEPPALKAVS